MKRLFYVVFIYIAVSSTKSETVVDSEKPHEIYNYYNRIPMPSSHGKAANSDEANVTVYLGYANNPFGPSIRFQHEKGNINYKRRKLKESSANKTEDDSTENILDTGQTMVVQEGRSKRGVVHLYNMVSCATGCDPLIYKGYGCYCGFLGSGYAVDGIDRCCRKHDWCYDATNCPTFLEYVVPYYWKCYHNRPLCAIDHVEWGGSGSCAHRLCECDKRLSECLSRYPCPSSRAICRSSPLRLFQNAFMIF